MPEAVVVAIITGACAIIAQLIISKQSSKDLYAKLDKQSELSDEKIQGEINVIKTEIKTLSERVDAHNNLIARTYEAEKRLDVVDERIRELKAKSGGSAKS